MILARAGAAPGRVTIEAAARLHFGMLDLRGSLGRRFGGMGAGVPAPSLLLEAERSAEVECEGPDAARAAGFARRVLEAHGVSGGARLTIRRAIPAHAGLGSGTQLALSVARAIAELYSLPTDAAALAAATGRARRSAIGTWTFEHGGFILEGGRREGTSSPAPLLARLPVPSDWRCVVAVPSGEPAVSGSAEVAAFARLPAPAEADVERVAYLVLMGVLPSLAEGDIATFGEALTEVQRITGRWFAAVQGGEFAPGATATLVRRMREWGAAGVGQSSWGPTAYGIVADAEAGAALAARVRDLLGADGGVYEGGFTRAGARVSRS
jgi:beta-RFAP synthase